MRIVGTHDMEVDAEPGPEVLHRTPGRTRKNIQTLERECVARGIQGVQPSKDQQDLNSAAQWLKQYSGSGCCLPDCAFMFPLHDKQTCSETKGSTNDNV